MDLSLGVFKDAAEAIDKLADTVEKLRKMIAAAIGGGYELMKWSEARETRKKMSSVYSGALHIWQGQVVALVGSVEDFLEHPTDESGWKGVREAVASTLKGVSSLLEKLQLDRDRVITEEFFAELSLTLKLRERALTKLLEIPTPRSEQEIESVRSFLKKYLVLVDQLQNALKLLNEYIEKLKQDGKWPIRGD
jgi:hypothetical protein